MFILSVSVSKQARFLIRTLSFIFLLFLSFSVCAQKAFLRGSITDKMSNPVGFATITIKGTSNAVTADSKGVYRVTITAFPATVICSAVGYEKATATVKKNDLKDSIAVVDFTLTKLASELSAVVVTSFGTVREKAYMDYTTASAPVAADAYRSAGAPTASAKISIRGTATTSGRIIEHDMAPVSTHRIDAAVYTDSIMKNNAKSRMLTAGELNDFKKWKMWEDYNKSEFKLFSESWGLFATQRYCVQLQNKDRKAVTGQTVYLLDNITGDTTWTAVSDNTGKAELWNGFNNKQKAGNCRIVIGSYPGQYPAIIFQQGINRIVIDQTCAVSNKVEIAFVVDATGSMQDEINYLKKELEDVLTKITVKDPTLDLQTAAVFYRDSGDEYLTRLQKFTKGITATADFIKKQNADGGNDYPEAVNEGLRDAIEKLNWSKDARSRIIFLLMDAPPHEAVKAEILNLTTEAAAKGIRVVPIACSGTDKETEFIMRSIALATNGNYLFLTDDSGIGNPHIKPTTDEFKVELLNDLLQRIIEQMCFANDCGGNVNMPEPVAPYNNTENIKLFPNPTTGPVKLQTNKKLKELFIADFTGKLLMRIPVKNKSNYQFDISLYPNGTYFVKYVTEDGNFGTEKIVLLK